MQLIPGCSVAIVNEGVTMLSHAAGWQKLDKYAFGGTDAVNCDTVFQTASISKTICATLCVLAKRRGFISSLDQSLESLLSIKEACTGKYIMAVLCL